MGMTEIPKRGVLKKVIPNCTYNEKDQILTPLIDPQDLHDQDPRTKKQAYEKNIQKKRIKIEHKEGPIFLSFGLAFFTPSTPRSLISTFVNHGGEYFPCSALQPDDFSLHPISNSVPRSTSTPRAPNVRGKEKGKEKGKGGEREMSAMDIDYYFVSDDHDPMLPLLRRRPFVLFRADWVLDSVMAGRRLGLENYIVDQVFYLPQKDANSIQTTVTTRTQRDVEKIETRENTITQDEYRGPLTHSRTDQDGIPGTSLTITTPTGTHKDMTSTLPTVYVDPLAFSSQKSLVTTSLAQSQTRPKPKSKTPRPVLIGKRPKAMDQSQRKQQPPRIVDLTHCDDEYETIFPPLPDSKALITPHKIKVEKSAKPNPFPSLESSRGPGTSVIRTIAPVASQINNHQPLNHPTPRPGPLDGGRNNEPLSPITDKKPLSVDQNQEQVKQESESHSHPRSRAGAPAATFRTSLINAQVFDFEDVYNTMEGSQTPFLRFEGLEPA